MSRSCYSSPGTVLSHTRPWTGGNRGVRGLLNGAVKGFVDLFGSWAPWVYIAALASILIWALVVRLTRGKRSN